MKISLRWLGQYLELDDFFENPQALADLLTHAGLEVENLEDQGRSFQHVVVGKIIELGRHPDADKLTLCQVDVGEKEFRQIVCGAKNHKQGDKVVAALPGAVLPGNFVIKKSKIRGVESLGMLCSETELGISEDSAGIMILAENAPVGQAFAEYYNLNDVVFDLSVTPNRADCLSHIGLVRELSCLLNQKIKFPQVKFTAKGPPTEKSIGLRIENIEACPRYAGRSIFGVRVGPSPAWLKTAVESVGLNSINNVVDVTNFVMMEMGQPLHAFDAKFLRGAQIIVANSEKGEVFQTLDGSELKLTGEELTIRDEKGPVALAGIIGGKNSGVNEKTQDIFLESAYFTSGWVRRTARRFGLDTDSSYRFARGTDPDGVVEAMNRACQLIKDVAGGEVSKSYHDHYPQPFVCPEISISKDYVESRLGYAILWDDFNQWMRRLGCVVVEGATAEESKVQTPSFRWDLNAPVDLVEEYARLNGYDKIPEHLPALGYEPLDHDLEYMFEKQVIARVCEMGFSQAVNHNFIGQSYLSEFLASDMDEKLWGIKINSKPVSIENPLSEDLNVMRTSLVPGLYKNALHNFRYGVHSGRLFEVGRTFGYKDAEYIQNLNLGFVAWGQEARLWHKDTSRPVVFDLKAAIEGLLAQLQIKSFQWRSVETLNVPSFLHPGQCASLFVEGQIIGFVGSLHPQRLNADKWRTNLAVGELDVFKLMRGQPRTPKIQSISKFPSVQRDFAFVLSEDLPVAQVIQQIAKVGGGLIKDIEVFDEYRGESLGEKKRSVAFRLTYQDMEGTLGEERLGVLQKEIITKVSQKLGLEIR